MKDFVRMPSHKQRVFKNRVGNWMIVIGMIILIAIAGSEDLAVLCAGLAVGAGLVGSGFWIKGKSFVQHGHD
jgi:hypothetical protein